MGDFERRQSREDKQKKKVYQDKFIEHLEHKIPLNLSAETATTSTYPHDSEHSERQEIEDNYRKVKENSKQLDRPEEMHSGEEEKHERKCKSQVKKTETDHPTFRVADEVHINEDIQENDLNVIADHARNYADQKTSKVDKKNKETRKSANRHSSRQEKNHVLPDEKHKSKSSCRHIRSKSIYDKLKQVENSLQMDSEKSKLKHSSKNFKYNSRFQNYVDRQEKQENSENDVDNNEGVKYRPTSKKTVTKNKHGEKEKYKKSISENREFKLKNTNEKRHQKRTESHRERKKQKKCSKCRSKITQEKPQRAYHSDSELDCGKGIPSRKTQIATFGTESDVSAMCHMFSSTGLNIIDGSNSTKDSNDLKNSHQVTNYGKKTSVLCEKCVRQPKTDFNLSRIGTSDSIRNKLISALFQRIKSLLKENETLKEEKNILLEKVTIMKFEFETIKAKEKQEQLLREKIDVLSEAVEVSNKGTFRDGVHHILKSTQRKYQTHWREHEHKISQVQADAENEIQILMKNIVTKYAEYGDGECGEETKNIINPKHITEPLYISTKINSNTLPNSRELSNEGMEEITYPTATKPKSNLLLKVAETSNSDRPKNRSVQELYRGNMLSTNTGLCTLQQHQDTHSLQINFEKPVRCDLFSTEPIRPNHSSSEKLNLHSGEHLANQKSSEKKESDIHKKIKNFKTNEVNLNLDPTRPSFEEGKISFHLKSHLNTSKPVAENTLKPNEMLSKKDAKEFWRQKLTQPVQLDVQKDFKESELNNRSYRIENRRNLI